MKRGFVFVSLYYPVLIMHTRLTVVFSYTVHYIIPRHSLLSPHTLSSLFLSPVWPYFMLISSFHELVSLTSQVVKRSQEGVICKIIGNLPRAAPLKMSPSPSNHSGLMYTQAGVRSQEHLPPLQWDEEKPNQVQIITAAENLRAQHSSPQHSSFLNNTPRSPHAPRVPHAHFLLATLSP